jgi:DNA-directed RNA polymerase specialized sigma24 family protein
MGDTEMVSGAPEPSSRSASPAGSRVGGGRSPSGPAGADSAARQDLDSLYKAHYCSLVRLAALLTGDAVLAEKVAADALVALVTCTPPRQIPDRALFHLRQQVVVRSRRAARSRSALRRGESRLPVPGWQTSPVVRVLESLSACQREAVVLRHYLDLGEPETAALMGASQRAVRRFLATAKGALQAIAPEEPDAALPEGS